MLKLKRHTVFVIENSASINDHQDASISGNSHYYRSYDVISSRICEKNLNSTSFFKGFFFLTRSWGLALPTHAQCQFFKIQMFILIHFTNLAAQNAAKQRMTKYHPQKFLNNNARSVVKSLPLKCRGVEGGKAATEVSRCYCLDAARSGKIESDPCLSVGMVLVSASVYKTCSSKENVVCNRRFKKKNYFQCSKVKMLKKRTKTVPPHMYKEHSTFGACYIGETTEEGRPAN